METLLQPENILNVTVIEPKLKHPTIFARFDELNPGESLTIHNDHDPKPLYYQLLGERGNIFDMGIPGTRAGMHGKLKSAKN